jgi:hypothetical protein
LQAQFSLLSSENSFSAGDFVRLCDKNLAIKGKILRFQVNFFATKPAVKRFGDQFCQEEGENIRSQRCEVGSFAKNRV